MTDHLPLHLFPDAASRRFVLVDKYLGDVYEQLLDAKGTPIADRIWIMANSAETDDHMVEGGWISYTNAYLANLGTITVLKPCLAKKLIKEKGGVYTPRTLPQWVDVPGEENGGYVPGLFKNLKRYLQECEANEQRIQPA